VTIVDHRSRQLVLSPLRNCIHRKCTEYRAVSCVFSRAARHTSTWDISWRKSRTSDDIVNAVHKAAAAKRSLATSSVATSLSICVFSRAARRTSTWAISWRKNRTSDDIVNAVHKAAAAKRSLATSSVATSLSVCVFSRAARRTSTWAISWRKSRTSRRRHSTMSGRGSTATRATQTSVR